MNLKEVIVSSLIIASIGCSKFLNISEEKKIKDISYKSVMESIDTPDQAKKYLTEYLYYTDDSINCGKLDCIDSFKKIHKRGHDDCDGGVVAAAANLKDNGYPPLFLKMCMYHPLLGERFCHAVYPYQENKISGLWGSLGISKADCKEPEYKTINDLVRSFGFFRYNVVNLDELYDNWIEKGFGDGGEIPRLKLKQVDFSKKINE